VALFAGGRTRLARTFREEGGGRAGSARAVIVVEDGGWRAFLTLLTITTLQAVLRARLTGIRLGVQVLSSRAFMAVVGIGAV